MTRYNTHTTAYYGIYVLERFSEHNISEYWINDNYGNELFVGNNYPTDTMIDNFRESLYID